VLEDDTSGAGLENTPEASTVGIDDQVYEDDASGADDATQEDFSELMPENPEEADAFSVEGPSDVGEYVQEPTDEPFYAYDESGVGIYVQEDFSEPTPDSIQEASTLGINEESYGYDAFDNYVQAGILESAPPEASTFNEPMYDYDAPLEASTLGANEPTSYGYDASGKLFDSEHANSTHRALMSSWMNGAGAMWAWDCDFPFQGDYMTVKKQNGAQCDPLCAQDPKCTHFAYNPYHDGSCYLKTGGAFKQDAKPYTPGMGVLCGIKKLSTPPLDIKTAQWMSDLPDRAELEDFLLPGTHNTIAGPQSAYVPYTPVHFGCDPQLFPGGSHSQCQADNISSQLNRGIRHFDFRLAECKSGEYDWFAGDKSLCFWHGTTDLRDYLDLSLEKVQWELFWFLQKNPRETIIVQISHENHDDIVKKEEFLGRVERYFEGHHEYWQHPNIQATNMNSNLRLGQVRGRIVVFWSCDFCGISKYGLDYKKIVNRYPGPNGDHSWPNNQAKFDNFLARARETREGNSVRGWYENKAAWTYTVWCWFNWVPLYPARVNGWTNPKVYDVLTGKYGLTISQKGIIPMDFPTNAMIRQIIAITRVRQLRYTTDINFWG
jgi:hypothetical protein